MQVETIKVTHDNNKGYKIINKCDFDDKIHTKYGVEKPKTRTRKKKVSNDDN